MSHTSQLKFVEQVKGWLPDYFTSTKVVEFGSLNINGSVRQFFNSPVYYCGVDLAPGPDVDLISRCHEADFADLRPDVVISCEMLEHDRFWRESLLRMYSVCRPGGLILFTCATDGRAEHGTSASLPGDSPFTNDWYMNLNEGHVRSVWEDCEAMFTEYGFEVGKPADLRFWGIKRKGV